MSAGAPPEHAPWQLICLCAAWCGVCRDWRPVLQALAREQPGWQVAWVDVEDEDEAMGEVDIETFPTVLVAHAGIARFLGPVAPSTAALHRLVSGLPSATAGAKPFSAASQSLLDRLNTQVLPRALMG